MTFKQLRSALLALTLFALAILIQQANGFSSSAFTVTNARGIAESISIPYSVSSPPRDEKFVFAGKLNLKPWSPRSLRFIPDDALISISINGENVDLSSIPENARKDWNHGFSINLANYLHSGENDIAIVVGDHGGKFGLNIKPSIEDWRGAVPILLLTIACAQIMLALARRMHLSRWHYLALVSGIALRVVYLAATNYSTRTHDVGAHLEYIEFFVNHRWSMPPLETAMGGAFFHPPFYYWIASWLYSAIKLFSGGDLQPIYLALQWFSTITAFAYVLFGLLIIQKASQIFTQANAEGQTSFVRQLFFMFAGLLFACWPAGVLHGIRISNDAFLYLFYAAGLYYLQVWFESRQWRTLFIAMLCAALATAAKANGVVLIGVGICVMLTAWIASPGFSRPAIRKLALLMIPPLLATALAFYPGMALKMQGKRTHTYVSNINNVGADQIVGAEAQNLLWFDTKMFVTEPFTSPWDDKMGRQFFANYLGKTALFGEWRYDGRYARNAAVLISISFIALTLLILYGFYRMPWRSVLKLSPLIYSTILLLAAISHMRMTFPVNIDFRYVLPVIASYASFTAGALCVFVDTGRNRLAGIGVLAQIVFLVSTIFFFAGVIGSN